MALAQLIASWDAGGRAQFSADFAEPSTPTFSSPPDRGTLDIPNCSYSGNVFTFRSRWDNTANSTGARFLFARIDGVLGLTPSFQLVRANLGVAMAASAKFVYSYDLVTWTPFSNRGTTSTYFTFGDSAPFSEDTVYVALWAAWPTGRTLPWIQSLRGPGYVSDTPSSTDFIFDTRDATVNESGVAITATNLYAFKVSNNLATAPDGAAKRRMVMFSGVHGSEDVGNYCLKGAVQFLVSEDAQAQTIRQWFDVFVYPLVASAGRKGGSTRGDFQSGFMTADVNRSWNGSTFETVVKHKAAVQVDTGGEAAVFFDFHGTHQDALPHSAYLPSTDQASWQNAIRVYIPDLRQVLLSGSGYSLDWIESALSPSIAIIPEYVYGYANTNQAGAEAYGANHMRAIALLAEQGYFGADYTVEGSLSVLDDALDTVSITGATVQSFTSHMAATESGLDTTSVIGIGLGYEVTGGVSGGYILVPAD